MDQKPLRHEEYLAMAAENEQLKHENEKIRMKLTRTQKYIGRRVVTFIGLFIVGWFVTSCVREVYRQYQAEKIAHPDPPPKPKTPNRCYWAEQDGHREPWDEWVVRERRFHYNCGNDPSCTTMMNVDVEKDGKRLTFPTQDEAWTFIKRYHLPECQ